MPTRRARLISKYHARPCVIDGIRFDSVKESKRYGELKILERVGQIRCLILQPKFQLLILPVLHDAQTEPIHCGEYRGDFQYEDVTNGRRVIEDTKGFRTDTYKLKKKLVEALYGVQITEV